MDFCKSSDIVFEQIVELVDCNDNVDDLNVVNDVIEFELENLRYVINKHSCSGQIWLSSPKSGPYHFLNNGKAWVDKDGIEIISLLKKELCL